MKKLFLTFFLLLPLWIPVTGFAAAGDVHLDHADVDLGDEESLQRGAKLFINYCLSCHSASYMRYSRTAEDLNIPEDVMKKNMLLATDKIGSTMDIAMQPKDAAKWLGVTPPDLSVIARSRGADWIYTFLNSFYLDPEKETGANNSLFKDTAMPHVLWELQGWQRAVYSADENNHGKEMLSGFELVSPGSMDPDSYEQATLDLVNYMVYMGEPAKLKRKKIGFWVILFLIVLMFPAYKLKKEYWKDVR